MAADPGSRADVLDERTSRHALRLRVEEEGSGSQARSSRAKRAIKHGPRSGTPNQALAQVGQGQLELVEAVVELSFTDHQRRGQPDRGTVGVLSQHMPPSQRLTHITAAAKAGINVNPGP